jgi:hypothetical protein
MRFSIKTQLGPPREPRDEIEEILYGNAASDR